MSNIMASSTLPLLTTMVEPATHHHERQRPSQEIMPISLGGKSALQPNKASAFQSPSLSQNQGFSTPPLLLTIAFHQRLESHNLSPSELAGVAYQNGPMPEHDRMRRVRSHVRCSKFRDSRHGKVGTQAAGILTPTRPRSEWELPEEISYRYCRLNL